MQSFKFFQREKRGDPKEYTYLHSIYQVMGLRKIYIILFDFQWNGYPEKDELMNQLRQYSSGYNEIYYEYVC